MQFALSRRGGLLPGETVLVLGSAGGIGAASIQLAKAMGAKVIAMVHRSGRRGVRHRRSVPTWCCRWPMAGAKP